MHRKLIHSARALGVTLSLLTAGSFLVVPAPAVGTLAVDKTLTPTAVEITTNADAAKAYSHHRRSQVQNAMALPFFSFAQGLRRGNRS